MTNEMIETNEIRDLALEFALQTTTHIFLTGKAGTGKTTLLHEILRKTKKKTAIVAPTGVAAINAGGVTIHSFLQLPTTLFLPDDTSIYPEITMDRHTLAAHQRFKKSSRKALIDLEMLVIDEISMVRADLLDAMDFTLRRIRKIPMPFGGLQVIAIGDLYQLSPVVKNHEWSILCTYYDSPYFFDSIVWRNCHHVSIELQKVYRQSDHRFISILNNIRNGIALPEDLDFLNKRVHKKAPKDAILLTTHNATANKINQDHLNAIQSKSIKLKAKVIGKFYESSYPTDLEIEVKIGARVMFVKNHQEGLYYNGKLGTITNMEENQITVICDDDKNEIIVSPSEWKNFQYSLDDNQKLVQDEIGAFTQFPIRLAWAVTVHKSQGLTFDEVQLDLGKTFASGQLYVALSRCRSLEGIYLHSPLHEENVITDKRISAFYHNEMVAVESLQPLLGEAKEQYRMQVLKHSFYQLQLIDEVEAWIEDMEDGVLAEEGVLAKKMAKRIHKSLLSLHEVAQKFEQELSYIFSNKEDVNFEQNLFIRTNKAIEYFTDILYNQVAIHIEDHLKSVSGSSKSLKKYKQEVRKLEVLIWNKIEELYQLQYHDMALHPSPPKHIFVNKHVPEDKSKPKETPTHEQTLELLTLGYSIDEIAKARGLVITTIEGHIAKLILSGQASINAVIEDEARLKTLTESVIGYLDEPLSVLKEMVGPNCSYGMLRCVVNHLKMQKERDEA